jgi:hypothetical protein
MSEPGFVERLEGELTAAARRRAVRRGPRWLGRLPLPRRATNRALVLVGAALLVGAGGTAGLLAARGEVGGPPSLEFVRLTPQQRAVGLRPLSRPVVIARGRLALDGRPWQLIGFQTTRGLCIEIDFPEQRRAGGCGSARPRAGRPIDWQAQIAVARLRAGLVLGAVDPAAETVGVRRGRVRSGPGPAISGAARSPAVPARVIHMRAPRLLAALRMRRPFAWYLAELRGPFHGMKAEARTAGGRLLGHVGIPYGMNDTSMGIRFHSGMCDRSGERPAQTRAVSDLVPSAVRERVAALRRPQRPSDLPPRWFMASLRGSGPHASVQLDAIRLMRRGPDGTGYYLVPTTRHEVRLVPPAGCLRTLTPPQRAREATLQRRIDAFARRPSIGLYAIGRRGGGSAGSFDLDAYRRGLAYYASHSRRLIGMAPDGVASVALRFSGGERRVARVVGNVWIAQAPPGRGPMARYMAERPRAVLWLDARGRVLRRLR